jgi:hypothetical protein
MSWTVEFAMELMNLPLSVTSVLLCISIADSLQSIDDHLPSAGSSNPRAGRLLRRLLP